VIKRDTITSYALQCPTSIVELGLLHAEQITLLEKVQNVVLAEQARLLDPGIPICPTCGNTLKKNGYKTSKFHAVFAQFINLCSVQILAKKLTIFAPFQSPSPAKT
jgi:hypothetical protein